MSLRRALVVDDSKLARVALKKQLEAYNLKVDLADSGEQALDFLEHNSVDVVFMDHVMPGMDGLTAVRALKRNPKTATIPVMMYTSKEGELYVSQARALGAVDVLPKDAQPSLLFDMLLKLGLVRDRRGGDIAGDSDDEGSSERSAGVPLQSVLSRIIEDQHNELRADLLGSQFAFARHVAHEVHALLRQDDTWVGPAREIKRDRTSVVLAAVAGVLAVALAAQLAAFFDLRADRNLLQQESTAIAAAADEAVRQSHASNDRVVQSLVAERRQLHLQQNDLYASLAWAMSEAGAVEFDRVPFDAMRVRQLEDLLSRLVNSGFRGKLLMESHLGEFCLVANQTGELTLADPGIPVSACTIIGHPLDESSLLAERETPTFAAFIAQSPLVRESGIDVEVVAHSRVQSLPRIPYPADPLNAGHWNTVAARNNRVDYTLIPAENRTARTEFSDVGGRPETEPESGPP